ncbi:MAG: putative DNA binding domain-containing protein [Caldilineaceae bacterium]|nr:putative DNA binding domain-containing protein [Caldilineaceae bacterium]
MSDLRSLIQGEPGPRHAFLPRLNPDSLAETLVAFANGEGGTVVLGVDANGSRGDQLVGDDVEGALRAALALCRPPMRTEWQEEETQSGPVIMLRVDRSSELHILSDGRALVRRGSENRPLSPLELELLVGNRVMGEFETDVLPGSAREDLDEDVIEEYLERRQQRNPHGALLPKNRLLQQIGAIDSDGNPTVSGMLLFGKEPQLFLPHSRAVFVKFDDSPAAFRTDERARLAKSAGSEASVYLASEAGSFGYGRREEITGPIARIVERGWRVIWEEMGKKAVVKGLQREDQTEYPPFAVREALVNAVCHRDYRLRGSSVEIHMRPDSLEIISPGGLPAYITIENIVEEHYSRNPRLVNGLYQWGYIEELGLGVDRMIEDMVAAGHPPPLFDAKSHRFSVTLQNRKDLEKIIPEWEQHMNERQLKAMQFVQANGSISNRDYRQLCTHVGAETLRLDLVDLVDKKLLLKIGDKRGTRYILR